MLTTRPSKPLPTGTCKQLAGRADFVAFLDLGVIAEDDRADFGFFEVEREADDAVGEFDHLVEHRVGQAFDVRDAVADFADDADVAFGRRGFQPRDLRFDFFQDGAHNYSLGLKLLLKALQAIAHAAVLNIAADADAHAAE